MNSGQPKLFYETKSRDCVTKPIKSNGGLQTASLNYVLSHDFRASVCKNFCGLEMSLYLKDLN